MNRLSATAAFNQFSAEDEIEYEVQVEEPYEVFDEEDSSEDDQEEPVLPVHPYFHSFRDESLSINPAPEDEDYGKAATSYEEDVYTKEDPIVIKGSGKDPDSPYSKAHYKEMKALLKERVKPTRFKHSVSVAKTAKLMAKAYGVDPDMAKMAGLLHDWDKALSDEELRDRVDTYGIELDPYMVENMPWLLHGYTGAAALMDTHPEFDHALYQAIARHTLGAPNMSKLDMIIYVADKIEPGHFVPVYQELYKHIGQMDLFDLYFAVQRENLSYLIDSERPLNLDAVKVWNHCVNLRS